MLRPEAVLAIDAPRRPAEAEAFRQLYEEHGAFVWRALRSFGTAETALEDATQDVFIIVFRRLAEYDEGRSFRGWLWGIARRVAATYQRTHQRARRREKAVSEQADRQVGPEGALAARRALALVETFLTTLPEGFREVFALSEVEGWTPTEIAETLGIRVGTVYSRLHTARTRFAEVSSAWNPNEASEP